MTEASTTGTPESREDYLLPVRSEAQELPRVGEERLARWRAARRILCVRLDNMGDVIMTGPAIRALAAGGSDRHVTLLTSPAGAAAGPLLPGVTDTMVFEAPWVKSPTPAGNASELREAADLLASREFDAAVVFTVYSQSPLPAAMLLHLADIPLRLAYCRENPYDLLSDRLPEAEPEKFIRHEVRRQLDLVGAVGASTSDDRLRLEPGARARREVGELLRRLDLAGSSDWFVVHPGASAPSRRYPVRLLGEALQELAADGLTPVLVGTAADGDLSASTRELVRGPLVDLTGRLDLAGLCALLERAPVLLANNSGPVHVAAAMGTSAAVLYAQTNPQHTPWGVPARVLYRDVPCRSCYASVCREGHHLCLAGVAPAEVASAVRELLSTRPPAAVPDAPSLAGTP